MNLLKNSDDDDYLTRIENGTFKGFNNEEQLYINLVKDEIKRLKKQEEESGTAIVRNYTVYPSVRAK
ncbi:MAG: hypothetical protein HC903_19055 [Methylacidiphilales bacterium]|nr:hypothetical protein [Candidatus Methylacidiphilales bacterium]NJR17120.1 hypothetical protein [Calothrix sp. CSU_2_0]